MRNRAKCKLCASVIESHHRYDWVGCQCGEITVSGGNDKYECSAKNWDNFLRVDDQDNVIVPKVVSNDAKEAVKLQLSDNSVILQSNAISYAEKLSMLKEMVKNLDDLPQEIMMQPINHYDFYSFVAVIISLLEQVDPRPSSLQPAPDPQKPSD